MTLVSAAHQPPKNIGSQDVTTVGVDSRPP